MSQVKSIFNNIGWLFVPQILSSICGFIWTVLIANYLGVNGNGILGFAISLSGILAVTTDFGISTHIVRHVSTDHSQAPIYLGNAIPLKSLFGIGTFILTLIILIILKTDELTITITLLFTIEMIINSFKGLFNGCFQAFEVGKYQGIGNILTTALLFIFILIAIFTDLGIYGITLAYVISNLIVLLYTYGALRKHIARPNFEINITFWKKLTLVALPFAATGILYSIYYSIDVIMLKALVGNYATGIYNATYKLVSVLTLFYSIYTAVIFPIMSKFFKNDETLLIVSFEKSIKYLMFIIIPLAFATVYYSAEVIHIIYPSGEFANASSVLNILIWTVCLLFISGACNTLLNASHKEVSVTKIYLIAATFNVILNFFMIPKYSYNGAAITTVLSDIIIVLLQSYVIYKLGFRPNKRLYKDLVKIIIGSVFISGVLNILHMDMILAIPVSITIYLIIMYLLNIFDNDDKYVIKEIIGKKSI